MSKKKKLFFYSEETVSYREANGFRLKFGASILGAACFGLFVIAGVNHFMGDPLGFERTSLSQYALENQVLKSEIKSLNIKMATIASSMEVLATRDNQLRTAVNLPKVDTDILKLGTGGAAEVSYAGVIAKDANELLSLSRTVMDKLDREIAFQRESYKEIYNKSQSNKELFASIPAIKPMNGEFSYHGFGVRRDPFLGMNKMHEGVDIHNDVGTPVYATGNGVVEFSGATGSAYGNSVGINHGFGYTSWYAHLSKTVVHAGQHVKRGMLIAYSGNTGRSTGPHLHYEVRQNRAKKNPVEFFVDDVDYDKIRTQLGYLKKK